MESAPSHQWLAHEADATLGEMALAQLSKRQQKIGAPSLSAAIVQHGELRWTGSVGWADIDQQIPATEHTKYRIGSTSKAVTATLLARFVDAGLAHLDLDMEHCLSPLNNKDWAPLTLRQLASHTAGIVGYEDNRDIVGFYQSMALQSHFPNSRKALSVFDGHDLLFKPGSAYHYSSYDFIMIAACLETIAGQDYKDLLSKWVTAPLGLQPLELDGFDVDPTHLAQFYLSSDGQYRPWRHVDLSHKAAGGGIIATPATIARIGTAWLDDGYISPATREAFWTPVKLDNGEVNEEDYALGWRRKRWKIEGVGTVVNLNHGGISKGSQFWLMVVPEHDLSLAIAMNGLTNEFFDFADVSAEILSTFLAAEL